MEVQGLFYDSFKHLKNNLSNLITTELLTLINSEDLAGYLALKPVNGKSKLPDMRKVGLIDYSKPSSNKYELTREAIIISDIFKEHSNLFSYAKNRNRNLTVKVEDIDSLLSSKTKRLLNKTSLKLILSYHSVEKNKSNVDDSLRPYLILITFLLKNNISQLDDELLKIILAQEKINILQNNIDYEAYKSLESNKKTELKRPLSYIKNFLQVSGVIDFESNVVLDNRMFKEVNEELNEEFTEDSISEIISQHNQIETRSSSQQRAFREQVLKNYGYKCAISGTPVIYDDSDLCQNSKKFIILEAAHIIPFNEGGSFSPTNGIALSPSLHLLFDLGFFTLKYKNENELIVIVSNNPKVKDNGILKSISGKKIAVGSKFKPDPVAIAYRSQHLL